MLVGWSHHVAIQLSHSTHVAGIQGPDVGPNPSRTSDVPCQSLGLKLLSGQFGCDLAGVSSQVSTPVNLSWGQLARGRQYGGGTCRWHCPPLPGGGQGFDRTACMLRKRVTASTVCTEEPLLRHVVCHLSTLWHLSHSGPVVPGRGGCGEMPRSPQGPCTDSHSSGDDRFGELVEARDAE